MLELQNEEKENVQIYLWCLGFVLHFPFVYLSVHKSPQSTLMKNYSDFADMKEATHDIILKVL